MSLKYFAVTVSCFFALLCTKVEVFANPEKDLWRHLFEGQEYDNNFRPVKYPKTAVQVSVGLAPVKLEQAIYPSTLYRMDSFLVVKWKDEYLMWNPKDFQNIKKLILPISKVWTPDLSVFPGNFESPILSNVTSNIALRFDGELTWVNPSSIYRYCTRPGSKLICVISIMSWKYDISQMNINFNTKMNELR